MLRLNVPPTLRNLHNEVPVASARRYKEAHSLSKVTKEIVPHYEELSVLNLMEQFQDDEEVLTFLSDLSELSKKLDR